MPATLKDVLHHQRIYITGPRANEILNTCIKVLNFYQKPYDLITSDKETLSDGPIVFIVGEDFHSFDPHIVLIDEVKEDDKLDYQSLADAVPKSGTLVFNSDDNLANYICRTERVDVHLEEYNGNDTLDAAKKILKRISINELSFNQAIQ